MKISLIAAMSLNRVIGVEGQIPWHLPNDFKHFKEKTIDKPIIMGRKTLESIGKPLPKRKNIVLSRSFGSSNGVTVVPDLASAIGEAYEYYAPKYHTIPVKEEDKEIMVIGGEQIYNMFLPIADRIYLTRVHTNVPCGLDNGEAFFPRINDTVLPEWKETDYKFNEADSRHNFDYAFTTLERIR